jgi:hypothetical protein
MDNVQKCDSYNNNNNNTSFGRRRRITGKKTQYHRQRQVIFSTTTHEYGSSLSWFHRRKAHCASNLQEMLWRLTTEDEMSGLPELSAFSGDQIQICIPRETELSTQFRGTSQEPTPRPRDIYLRSHYLVANSRASNHANRKARDWWTRKWIRMKMVSGMLLCMALSTGNSAFHFKWILFVTGRTPLFFNSPGPLMGDKRKYYIGQVR